MKSAFPIDCLPKDSLISTYTKTITEISESPIQYHFASIIAGISVLLGRRVSYNLGFHTLFPNAYIMVVGESGMTRKSSSTRPILNTLRSMSSHLILPTNISNESLVPSFNMNSTRIMFFDEMKLLFDLASRSYGNGIITTLTTIHECPNEIRSEFKKDFDKNGDLKSTSRAQYPFLTIMGLTTQSWLNVSNTDISGGFLGRFWPIISIGEIQKTIAWPESNEDFMINLRSKFNIIHKLSGKFTFSDAARPLWKAKYESLMAEVRSHKNDQFASFGSRLGDTAIKLSMLISASMPKCEFQITPEVFESACHITDYLKESYLILLSELSPDKFSSDEKRLEIILRLNKGRMSKSDLLRDMRTQTIYLDSLAKNLEEKGKLFALRVKTSTKPRVDYFLTESFTWNTHEKRLFDAFGAEIALKTP